MQGTLGQLCSQMAWAGSDNFMASVPTSPSVGGNKICQGFCPQADVDASHPGAQAPQLRPGRSPEWVPRLPARPCQRSPSRPEGGLRPRELNGQVPVCAWQPRLDKSCGPGRQLGRAAAVTSGARRLLLSAGKNSAFGCLLLDLFLSPQLPTQRITQIGGSRVIASW